MISQGKPKFETYQVDPPKKEKWKTKKRFKLQKKREKEKRKAANRRDPRRLGHTGKKKKKFANAEERIKYKLEKVTRIFIVFFSFKLGWLGFSCSLYCFLKIDMINTNGGM